MNDNTTQQAETTSVHEQITAESLDLPAADPRIKNVIAAMEDDMRINHPGHYGGDTTYEAIKVIEAWELNFRLGNCVKYIPRAGKKVSSTDAAEILREQIIDLKKARWYLDREIAVLETQLNATA